MSIYEYYLYRARRRFRRNNHIYHNNLTIAKPLAKNKIIVILYYTTCRGFYIYYILSPSYSPRPTLERPTVLYKSYTA